ncbi:hypothetical protein D1AOALGA4SA_432 [Olavius algarvensis Delta 1 endosymbiont]|nr:hypothetical protein D1AOALGA4SA_432 [Olavius algarvensis Delta 1 endosymbiont]
MYIYALKWLLMLKRGRHRRVNLHYGCEFIFGQILPLFSFLNIK